MKPHLACSPREPQLNPSISSGLPWRAVEHTSGEWEGQRLFRLHVCAYGCEELKVTAGWWLAQRPTDAGISASAINSPSLYLSHVHKCRASLMQAVALKSRIETEVIMWRGRVWKYASIYMLYLESGEHTDVKTEWKKNTSILHRGEHRDDLLDWKVAWFLWVQMCTYVRMWWKGGKRLCCCWRITVREVHVCLCVCICACMYAWAITSLTFEPPCSQ